MGCGEVWRWVGLGGQLAGFDLCFSLFYWENSLLSNASSNTIEACNSGTLQQRRATRAVGWMRPSTTSTQPRRVDHHHRNRRT